MKPHIDDVCAVFQNHHGAMIRALTRHKPLSEGAELAATQAKDELRMKLDSLGLANYINWGDGTC